MISPVRLTTGHTNAGKEETLGWHAIEVADRGGQMGHRCASGLRLIPR
jgi:hypothetical protein